MKYLGIKRNIQLLMSKLRNSNIYVEIDKLKPTQCAVGMDHVNRKVSELQTLKKENDGQQKVSTFLKTHAAPVVLKGDDIYLIDNHHLCRALHELGDDFFKDVPLENGITSNKPIIYIKIVSDLSALEKQNQFWEKMSEEKWVHPYDKYGKGPVPFDNIPTKVKELDDDIFRSVAAVVKIQGGFKKTFIPYAEFQWANYFRSCWPEDTNTHTHSFDHIVEKSMEHAVHSKAKDLPGYVGK
ncbi:hypothetical protein DLAC_00744 [Tieghemostelium lacteum]|uniref:Chromosome partitioning protein ParB n=1 Tax=Tieghemostelium lacteum TaxID=361077 RepID=A0A152A6W6_TIELA|nr:hypothetical protein DLAC_00744 [Tieghemostelium lacteum]|eukprot:KYR01954.1 hypothetical protein DLAC_00744 [Tieghemostelium lacteum]